MSSQQIVDYIAKQIKNGHSEKSLRKHMRAHGWSAAAVSDAFTRYHSAQKYSRPVVRHLNRRQKLREGVKATLVLALLAVVAGVVMHFVHRPEAPVVHATPIELTNSQKQMNDIITIGGAIGQYAAANGVLPTHLVVGDSETSLVMCDAVCNPTTSQISSLYSYKATNVQLKDYVAGLTVPNEQTAYLVTNGTCKDKVLGPASASPRAMVILYAATSGNTISQHCLKL